MTVLDFFIGGECALARKWHFKFFLISHGKIYMMLKYIYFILPEAQILKN